MLRLHQSQLALIRELKDLDWSNESNYLSNILEVTFEVIIKIFYNDEFTFSILISNVNTSFILINNSCNITAIAFIQQHFSLYIHHSIT